MYSVVATYLQCRPELGEQHTSETDAMDVSAWTRVVHISADQRLYQLGCVRQKKIFLLLLTVFALLYVALL